jgi:hypothetical protein
MQSNQQLALSRLMHIIHLGNTIFPDQALERRPVQETLNGCAGLYNGKFSSTEHSSCLIKAQNATQHPERDKLYLTVLLQVLNAVYYFHLIKMFDLLDTVRQISEKLGVTWSN